MRERTRPAPCQGKTGPAEGTPSKTSSIAQPKTTINRSTPPHRVVPLPLRWAKSLIDAAEGPVPEYGSDTWAELDDGPQKVAGCVLAAERWRTRHHQPEFLGAGSRRARQLAEARRPRPGDHPGGPVRWEPEVASGE